MAGPPFWGLPLAGSGLSAGVAAADVQPTGPFTWCPGDAPVPTGNIRVNPVIWDENVCHDYWYVYHGQGFVPPPPIPPGWCWGLFLPSPCP